MFATKNEKDSRDEEKEDIKSLPLWVLLVVVGLHRTCGVNVAFVYSVSTCSAYVHVYHVHLFFMYI